MKNRIVAAAVAAFAMVLALFTPAAVAEYPDHPLRIIVPYAAGGGADLLARLVGQKLSERLKQPVVVENQGGASNTIGMGTVKRADPDGYTLGLATPVFVVAPVGMKSKPYDPVKDFEPVAMIGVTPLVLVVHPSVPAKTLQEFIALNKAKPNSMNFASLGSYTTQGLAAYLFNQVAGIRATEVPYKGSAPGTVDLLAGNVQYFFNALPSMLGYIKSGKLRALGVSGAKRAPDLPDVPAIKEVLPSYVVTTWYSFVAPKGTPPEVVARLNKEINEVVQEKDVVPKLRDHGVESDPMPPEQLGKLYETELAKWTKVAQDAKLKQE
ncbi:MAG TPA: tripartite tricarboxylate transporter substrate binding protein [Usitatibacter sp.]|jgi:tripartite-type tricarboxylate transporter receptor subunit TctC|nr:tripartite tricarboxylate transporter substrate binding protein [Usitatibacter sp.]